MDVDIKLMQNKICHPVEEIRGRSVNSLLYKLEQKLVDSIVLVNETQLCKALIKSIELGGPSVNQVLSIMDLLSSENQGISTLGNVGALQSLNKYKSSCQPYNVLADKIIDKILSQPTQVIEVKEDVADLAEVNNNDSTKDTRSSESSASQVTSNPDVTNAMPQNIVFPFVKLNDNDTRILKNIEDRLLEETLFSQSCTFFQEVLLRDYPSEVFLQNTGPLLTILKLLRDSSTLSPVPSIEHCAISAISRLIECLDVRISLLSRCWISNPKWNKSQSELESSSSDSSETHFLSLPKFLFIVLKFVLPVYKRCEDETAARLLARLLCNFSKLLDSLNAAPFTFNVNTSQLQQSFGLLGEGVRSLYRKWNKTCVISSLTPTLLAALIAFSVNFFRHFLPPDKYSEYIPTTLLDVFRDLYFNQTFYLSHKCTYEMLEEVLAVTSPDLLEQRVRVNMMLDMISTVTSCTASSTASSTQHVYDGLEGAAHFKDESLLHRVVQCLLDNMCAEKETCANSIVWLLSNKTVNKPVYTLLSETTRDKFILFHPDVLWEVCVHGLNSPPDILLPASLLLSNLLASVDNEAPATQHKFYQALQKCSFFVTCSLTHIPELRSLFLGHVTRNARFMTELESVKIWVAMLFSRSEEVRKWPVLELAKWAASQGVGIKLSESCLVVPESSKTVLSISMTTGNLDTQSIEKLKLISFNTSLSEELRVSALQQLAVLLSDASVHGSFITLPSTLVGMLGDMKVKSEMVLPTLRSLRHLIHHNPISRESLAADTELYVSLLRIIGLRVEIEAGFEVSLEVKAEVGTILILLIAHEFSSPRFWSNRSYYDLYNVLLPDSVPLSLHLPSHLTTLAPSRPLPPPVVPGVWLPWLQSHYHVELSGGVETFIVKECEIPSVDYIRECLQVSYIPYLLSEGSNSYLEISSSLALLSRDAVLSSLVQYEIGNRVNDTPKVLSLLKLYNSPLSTNIIGYMMSKLEETTDSAESTSTSHCILELYSTHEILQGQCGGRLFGPFLRLFKTTSDKITLSQQLALCLAISSQRIELSLTERRDVIKTITKQIDTLSHGRGDSDSFMGAHILRYLFCCLTNVTTPASTSVKIRWIIPWITDKDPVIRSCAFSLEFQSPDSPLTTESAVVLAISAFVDNSEIFTVRQQALAFVDRVVSAVSVREEEQTLALCMLAIKRMALFDSCTAFVAELSQLVLFKQEDFNTQNTSQMICSLFEEGSETLWNASYVGLFYILDSVLQLNITLAGCKVVVMRNNSDLLTPLYSLFNAQMLNSLLLCDVPSLELYTSCFCKVLALTDTNLCGSELLLDVINVMEVKCEDEPVINLKAHCLIFVKKLIHKCVLDDYWGKILPLTSKFLAYQPLQLHSLQIIGAALSHQNKVIFATALEDNVELSKNLSAVIFEIFSRFKITSLGQHDMMIFSVTGMLCKQVPCCRDLAISHGILEICYEYLLLLSQHMGALAVAAGKENISDTRAVKTSKFVEDKQLLKSLSCVVYCLCCCVDNSVIAATRLADLDIIATLNHMWCYFSHNILAVNYVVKMLSLLAQTLPESIKMLLVNKGLFGHVLDASQKSVQFSKHPLTPLRDVLFQFLCVVSASNEAVSHIWKSGFMSNFPKFQKQKTEPLKLGHWLKLVLQSTYTPFGQKMVLTIPHILDIILECGHKYNSLLFIRNVVFNVKSHPKLLTHSALLDFVLSSVVFEKPKQAFVALQIMLYFIKFSSKAKSIWRDKGAGQTLGKLELRLKDNPNSELFTVLEPLLSSYSL